MKLTPSRIASVALAALLAACATPDKPARATLYDFGPGPTVPAPVTATLPSLVLGDIDATGAIESTALNYRLTYADENQLRPYAHARWTVPPPQLIRQRLRELLGRDRAILDINESAAMARTGGAQPRVLRLDLEEFSQVFDSEAQSFGLIRLRATLMENTPAGERLVSQRMVLARAPAPTADAPGGVRALATAMDTAATEIAQWLQQQR